MIQDQLKEVGIDIKIDNFEGAAVFDQFFPESATSPMPTTTSPCSPGSARRSRPASTRRCHRPGSGQNEMSYTNQEVDDLFTQAIRRPTEEAADLINQIDEILWEDLPSIPLYQSPRSSRRATRCINIDRQREHRGSALERRRVGRQAVRAPE